MECLASDVKLFGECLLRLNSCVYCVVEPKSRKLIYTFIETQEPLHVSEDWVVFRSQACSLRGPQRQITLRWCTKARVLDVNDSTILYSDGTAVEFTAESQRQSRVDVAEFPLLTPTGFAVQDRQHTKLQRLHGDDDDDDKKRTVVLPNVVPSHLRSSRYILNHHGDVHLIISADEKTDEHWVVDLKGHKFRMPHAPVKIHRRFIQLEKPDTVFRRHAETGDWDVAKHEFGATKEYLWEVWHAASHALVRNEDFVGRNASSWVLMNVGVKLVAA